MVFFCFLLVSQESDCQNDFAFFVSRRVAFFSVRNLGLNGYLDVREVFFYIFVRSV